MARKVYVSSDIATDPHVDEVSEKNPLAALMWPWLLTVFDDWGRAEASSRKLKRKLFPGNDLITAEVIEAALQLFDGHLITLYEVEGRRYMCLDMGKWFSYQTQIRKEKRFKDNSQFPPPEFAELMLIHSPQVREESRDSAQVRELTSDGAELRANLADCIPSPSLSLSPSPSKDISSGDSRPNAHSAVNVYGIYEREIGQLTHTVSQKLITLEEEYTEEWLKKAIENAVFAGVKTIKYIEGTLRKWLATNHSEPWKIERPQPAPQADGSGKGYGNRSAYNGGGNRSGSRKPTLQPVARAPTSSAPSQEELEEIRQLAKKLQEDKPDRLGG